jgi:hypothetical protein
MHEIIAFAPGFLVFGSTLKERNIETGLGKKWLFHFDRKSIPLVTSPSGFSDDLLHLVDLGLGAADCAEL